MPEDLERIETLLDPKKIQDAQNLLYSLPEQVRRLVREVRWLRNRVKGLETQNSLLKSRAVGPEARRV